MNRTLLVVKPHAVDRGLTGIILHRLERMGLRIEAIKSVCETPEFWQQFYPSTEFWLRNVGLKTLQHCRERGISAHDRLGTDNPEAIGGMVKKWLVEHMSSGNSVAVVLRGNDAARKVRLACGNTLPNAAAPGTIRFDFSNDSPDLANEERRPVFNLVHASDPDEVRDNAVGSEFEISLIFPELTVS